MPACLTIQTSSPSVINDMAYPSGGLERTWRPRRVPLG